MKDWHVGQKIVCVDDRVRVSVRRLGWFSSWRRFESLDHNLNRGDTYTIKAVHIIRCVGSGKDHVCLLLSEAVHFKFPEVGFPDFQFRPLVERKTDIGIFQRMLLPSRDLVS